MGSRNLFLELLSSYDLHITSDMDGNEDNEVAVYALSTFDDSSAGIKGEIISPYFYSENALENWFMEQEDRIADHVLAGGYDDVADEKYTQWVAKQRTELGEAVMQ